MLISPAKREVRDWHGDSRVWKKYRPRPDDIVIGTSAKCGTTWMQQIVCLLVFQSAEPRPIHSVSAWLDARFFAPEEEMLARVEAQTHRRFIKTHLQFDALPIYDEVSYIHVARDGRDACFSWHHHGMTETPEVLARLDAAGLGDPVVGRSYPRPTQDPREFYRTWMEDVAFAQWKDGWPAQRYFDLERSYWAARKMPNMLMVHYNDLKADLDGEMRRIADFLHISVPQDVWPSLVEAATFESMKRKSAEIGPGFEIAFKGGMDGFLHSGTNARWRDVLTPKDIADYEARLHRETSPGLARWLEHGRLIAGEPRTTEDGNAVGSE